MTPLEEKVRNDLKTLALTDFDKFLSVTGVDLQQMVICERRRRNDSIRKIAIAMGMPVSTVQGKCDKCE